MPSTIRTIVCHSISLGCPKNRVDTEQCLGRLPNVRLVPTERPEEADLVFINTCAFIQPAIEESVHTIVQIIADCAGEKEKPLLVVAGCLPGRFGAENLAPDLPEVDLWLDSHHPESWASKLSAALNLSECTDAGRLIEPKSSYAWLKISEGCSHACAFCTIPSIRGRHRSIAKKDIQAEAKLLLEQGVRELVLVAQDTASWGNDFAEKQTLVDLLENLLPLSGLERLRLLYLYPAGLTPSLLDFLRHAGAPFVPYFDIPLQHADPAILSRMGRPFAGDPKKIIDRVRNVFPEAVIRTTLMTGFPGETEASFQTLLHFVEEIRFQHLGVFAWQAEEGTPAATMPNQVEEAVKNERRDILMETQKTMSAEWLAGFVGTQQSLLVDAPHPDWPGLYTSRTWFQAPEIDGITYVSGPNVQSGTLVQGDIVESRDYDLVALTN